MISVLELSSYSSAWKMILGINFSSRESLLKCKDQTSLNFHHFLKENEYCSCFYHFTSKPYFVELKEKNFSNRQNCLK